MKEIDFEYPVVYLDKDYPEDSYIENKSGSIILVSIKGHPYESVVKTDDCSFDLIFDKHNDGNFLCIPDWHVGCELSDLSDMDWNLHSILETQQIDFEDATAITEALKIINGMME